MINNSYSQSAAQNSKQSGLFKWIAILGCAGILVLLIVIIVLGGMVYMRGSAASQSEIFFRSPQNGERVEAGHPVQVRVLARDEQKILRIELWADGRLIETQTSSIPGGSNPFPLLTDWIPEAGSHTLIARSINNQNETAQADITIEAETLADRDADSVADNLDACPDQAGNPAAGGCPDRDLDGIADTTDACPDVAGVPENGCPLPTADDTDGDGVLNTADACPEESGSPLAEGCVDRDADGTSDRSDACPDEPGSGEDGCPTGDADGDTILDADDACPHEWGLPENAGCPDADGDGVIDSDDDCPAEPGGADGCPDVAPGGGDPPEGDDHTDDEGVSGGGEVFGDAGGDVAVETVQLEALKFTVTQDYDEIYCYAGVVDAGIDRYGPFDALSHHEWDIEEYMGGENSRTLYTEVGANLELTVECIGTRGDSEFFDLGSFTRGYDISQWDGHILEEMGGATEEERGDPGHTFNLQFRLCHRSCDASTFPPPVLRHTEERIGPITNDFLQWEWDGDRDDITGFRLYVNGHYRETIRNADATRLNLDGYMPHCEERNEYSISAYQLDGVVLKQSPRSNSVYMHGETCPRRVKVTFEELGVSDLRTFAGDMDGRGPIYGTFWASGNVIESLRFDGGECTTILWAFHCRGYEINNGSISISNMFDSILAMGSGCIGSGCVDLNAPAQNFLIIDLEEGDDISFGASIWDEEAYGSDEHLFDDRRTISAAEPLPVEITLVDNNYYGRFTLRVQIEEVDD